MRKPPELSEADYDFYRCFKCGRLITRVEEVVTLQKTGQVCPCGSRKYQPTNMRWYHWFLPRVWKFAYLRIMGVY